MIYREQLESGLRIVVEEIPSVRSVSLGIWVGTGSRYEQPADNGISHFLEHMFFKGTESLNARQLAEVFDGIGGQVNAFTTKEYTCYYAKVLDEHFQLALSTLADMFFHSQFEREELVKEKKVVTEEIKMYEDAPDEVVHDLIAETSYPGHALGYNILGTEMTVNSFTREQLLDYIHAHYTPDNTVISVAGNVQADHAVQLIRAFFSGFSGKRASIALSDPVFVAGQQHKYKTTEQAHVCLASEGLPVASTEVYALVLLNNTLGGSSSSRLFQEIREDRGLAYSVFSYHSSYRETGMFGVYVGTAAEQVNEVVQLTRKIIDDIVESGITDAELQKGKDQVKGSLMLSLESTSSRMSRLGKNELLLRRQVDLDETIACINNVSPSDVKRMARKILGGKLAIASVGPLDVLKAAEEVS